MTDRSDDQLACAFTLADNPGAHRRVDKRKMMTKELAYTRPLVCRMWALFGACEMSCYVVCLPVKTTCFLPFYAFIILWALFGACEMPCHAIRLPVKTASFITLRDFIVGAILLCRLFGACGSPFYRLPSFYHLF